MLTRVDQPTQSLFIQDLGDDAGRVVLIVALTIGVVPAREALWESLPKQVIAPLTPM
jgi:hypothetical protein